MEQPRNVNSILELTIQSQDGSKLFFRMKPNITMRTIFKYYCKEKQIIDYRTVHFVFDGQRISARMTVEEAGLKDSNQIDAVLDQDGGGYAL
ncbi:small ubiquitin-related modifier 2-like [Capsicum annuum]|uniref:small ubiquitin-related modifier 2-like n=1 Tax=Capsicum annuum TaxID=4072 RepID=UPI001FB128DF|nr:small ubiquitin-related modifier 2-like [Capsicum annuum]